MRTFALLLVISCASGCLDVGPDDPSTLPPDEAAVLAAKATGGGGGGKKGTITPAPALTPAATIALSDATTGVVSQSYPMSATGDIEILTAWKNLAPGSVHVQHLYVYAPGGSLFQAATLSFAAGAAGTASVIELQPVNGTAITEYGLSGTWTVAAYLDGSSAPAATSSFLLY